MEWNPAPCVGIDCLAPKKRSQSRPDSHHMDVTGGMHIVSRVSAKISGFCVLELASSATATGSSENTEGITRGRHTLINYLESLPPISAAATDYTSDLWSEGDAIARTAMDDRIFHADALEPEIFFGARCLVKIQEYFVNRIPACDQFVNFLFTHSLTMDGKPPQ